MGYHPIGSGERRTMQTHADLETTSTPFSGSIEEPIAIVESLKDNPAEAIAFALAHAVFDLRFGMDISLQMTQADAILRRLEQLGFKIVRADQPLA
jgi:hypothetical protein